MTRRALLIAVLTAVAAILGGRAVLGDAPASPADGVVVRVVDGDTIRVRLGDSVERVRYIGIDTPETVKPGTPVQCYGKAASAFNARLVRAQHVRLEFDAERRDRYGRLLAYVYRKPDGLFVNAELVRRGYAETLQIAPNVAHARQLAGLARAAQRARRGLWATCGAS